MNTEKYYTPTVEEFHVGFEFEQVENCSVNNSPRQLQWKKKKYFGWDSYSHFDVCYSIRENVKEIRVKYLDREDLISLGWMYTFKSIADWYTIDLEENSTRLSSGRRITKWQLIHDRHNEFLSTEDWCHNIKIVATIDGCDEETFFEGLIKNKSELYKLMKQLGIT